MPKKNYEELIRKSKEREQKKCKKLQDDLDKKTTKILAAMRQVYTKEEEYRFKLFKQSQGRKK